MAKKRSYDWDEIVKEIMRLIHSQENMRLTISELSKKLNMPKSTLSDGLRRHKLSISAPVNREETVTAEIESDHPKTIQDMADAVGVNLEEYEATKFETTVKNRFVGKEERILWTTKAVFSAKPNGFHAGVQVIPITFNVQPESIVPEIADGNYTHLVIADLHFGFEVFPNGEEIAYHDEALLADFLALVEFLKPAKITLLGDILDLPEFSDKFLTKTGQANTAQKAIERAGKFLFDLRQVAGACEICVIEGNHDKRLRDALYTRFPNAADLYQYGIAYTPVFSLPHLLGLGDLGIRFVGGYPDEVNWDAGVAMIHGTIAGGKPGATAAKYLDDFNFSVIFGHAHRQEFATKRIVDKSGETVEIFAYSPGCACRIDGVVPGSSKFSNWQQGAGAMTVYNQDKPQIENFPYIQGLGFAVRGSIVRRSNAENNEQKQSEGNS